MTAPKLNEQHAAMSGDLRAVVRVQKLLAAPSHQDETGSTIAPVTR